MMPENAKPPERYVPPTEEARRASYLESVKKGLSRIKALPHSHTIDIKVRRNGKEEWYEGDWIKYLPHVFPELMQAKKPAWRPDGEGLPPKYSHHPALANGELDGKGHVVCRLVPGWDQNLVRIVWMAVGRNSQHALELAWQHHEGESLTDPMQVWMATRTDSVSPQW